MSQITIKDMLDAGVHFGHQTHRWNPLMKPYVFTSRGGIHIIDLQKSVVLAKNATKFIESVGAKGGQIIFVGTKRQSVDAIQEAAKRCGQYYVTKRWLGGMLTNFETIKSSISRLQKIEQQREGGDLDLLTKKERARIEKQYTRLTDFLEGIKDMKEMPDCMFVVDLNKEAIAVTEAKKLGIPVIGIADTNCNPGVADYPIPGNDDAIRSIKLFTNLIADAYLKGKKTWTEAKPTAETEAQDVAGSKSTAPQTQRKAGDTKGGPEVVTVARKRIFVPVGTADEAEIDLELDAKVQPTDKEAEITSEEVAAANLSEELQSKKENS